MRNDVLARHGGQCANCGTKEELEVHHVVPLSRGRTNRRTNLLTVPQTCHNGAHDRSARVETDDPGSDRVRWLPAIGDVRHLARTTRHPLRQAVVALLAKTGLSAGEVRNLLFDDVALADADASDPLDREWADETASFLRVRGATAETR